MENIQQQLGSITNEQLIKCKNKRKRIYLCNELAWASCGGGYFKKKLPGARTLSFKKGGAGNVYKK